MVGSRLTLTEDISSPCPAPTLLTENDDDDDYDDDGDDGDDDDRGHIITLPCPIII